MINILNLTEKTSIELAELCLAPPKSHFYRNKHLEPYAFLFYVQVEHHLLKVYR